MACSQEIKIKINMMECRRGVGLSSNMKKQLSKSQHMQIKSQTSEIKNGRREQLMTKKCNQQIKGTSRSYSKKDTVNKIRFDKKRKHEERLSIMKTLRKAIKCRNIRANNRTQRNIERGCIITYQKVRKLL